MENKIDPRECLVLKIAGRITGKAVLFIKLDSLFPECSFQIKDLVQLFPLHCLKNNFCPRNLNCMGKLANRVKLVFDTFPDAVYLLLYFKWRDKPDSHRAGLFSKDLQEPRFLTLNRSSWEKMKEIGVIYSWNLPEKVFLS